MTPPGNIPPNNVNNNGLSVEELMSILFGPNFSVINSYNSGNVTNNSVPSLVSASLISSFDTSATPTTMTDGAPTQQLPQLLGSFGQGNSTPSSSATQPLPTEYLAWLQLQQQQEMYNLTTKPYVSIFSNISPETNLGLTQLSFPNTSSYMSSQGSLTSLEQANREFLEGINPNTLTLNTEPTAVPLTLGHLYQPSEANLGSHNPTKQGMGDAVSIPIYPGLYGNTTTPTPTTTTGVCPMHHVGELSDFGVLADQGGQKVAETTSEGHHLDITFGTYGNTQSLISSIPQRLQSSSNGNEETTVSSDNPTPPISPGQTRRLHQQAVEHTKICKLYQDWRISEINHINRLIFDPSNPNIPQRVIQGSPQIWTLYRMVYLKKGWDLKRIAIQYDNMSKEEGGDWLALCEGLKRERRNQRNRGWIILPTRVAKEKKIKDQ